MQLERLKSLPCIYSINLRNNKRIFSLLNRRSRREKLLLEPNSQYYSLNQLRSLSHSRTTIKTTLRLGSNTLTCLLSNPNILTKSTNLDPISPNQQHLLQDSNQSLNQLDQSEDQNLETQRRILLLPQSKRLELSSRGNKMRQYKNYRGKILRNKGLEERDRRRRKKRD